MNIRPLFGECPTDLDPILAKRIDEIDSAEPHLIESPVKNHEAVDHRGAAAGLK